MVARIPKALAHYVLRWLDLISTKSSLPDRGPALKSSPSPQGSCSASVQQDSEQWVALQAGKHSSRGKNTTHQHCSTSLTAETPWQAQMQKVLLHLQLQHGCKLAAAAAAAAGGRCLQMPCQALLSPHDREAAPN
jgi:hypothetical protein